MYFLNSKNIYIYRFWSFSSPTIIYRIIFAYTYKMERYCSFRQREFRYFLSALFAIAPIEKRLCDQVDNYTRTIGIRNPSTIQQQHLCAAFLTATALTANARNSQPMHSQHSKLQHPQHLKTHHRHQQHTLKYKQHLHTQHQQRQTQHYSSNLPRSNNTQRPQ